MVAAYRRSASTRDPRPDAAPGRAERIPEPRQAFPQRRDHPHAGDDDAPRLTHDPPNFPNRGLDFSEPIRGSGRSLRVRVLLDVLDRVTDRRRRLRSLATREALFNGRQQRTGLLLMIGHIDCHRQRSFLSLAVDHR